uniref:Putative secreted protein n=1 Tax=Anopheles darlingi TaxID=43151 RepID=A0A2M4DPA2_ANODA
MSASAFSSGFADCCCCGALVGGTAAGCVGATRIGSSSSVGCKAGCSFDSTARDSGSILTFVEELLTDGGDSSVAFMPVMMESSSGMALPNGGAAAAAAPATPVVPPFLFAVVIPFEPTDAGL